VRVLAGVNLPMLVRGVCYRACDLDTLVEKALAGAAKGVHAIAPLTSAAAAGQPLAETECAAPGVPVVEPASKANATIAETATANSAASVAGPTGPAR